MEFIAEIRRRHFVGGESISSIARSFQLSRPTVRKHLRTVEKPVYERQHQPCPKLGEYQGLLEQWLKIEGRLPKRQRRTAQRLFEGLQVEGYRDSYDQIQRFVKRWKVERLKEPAVTQCRVFERDEIRLFMPIRLWAPFIKPVGRDQAAPSWDAIKDTLDF